MAQNYIASYVTNERMKEGSKCFWVLLPLKKPKDLSKTMIRPVALYACETWRISRKDELKQLHGMYGL